MTFRRVEPVFDPVILTITGILRLLWLIHIALARVSTCATRYRHAAITEDPTP